MGTMMPDNDADRRIAVDGSSGNNEWDVCSVEVRSMQKTFGIRRNDQIQSTDGRTKDIPKAIITRMLAGKNRPANNFIHKYIVNFVYLKGPGTQYMNTVSHQNCSVLQ